MWSVFRFFLLFLTLILSSRPVLAQRIDLRVERITIQDGLSQSSVVVIHQDKQGFLWFGTQDGLNRYDGYTFTVYKNDAANPKSISDNWINSIAEDSSGNLWIGTSNGGLNKFDPETESFSHYRHDPVNPYSLKADRVLCTFVDSDNLIWVGTAQGGLHWLKHDSDQLKRLDDDRPEGLGQNDDNIVTIVEGNENKIWAGTSRNGLFSFDKKTGHIQRYAHDPDNPNSLCDNNITKLMEDWQGFLWVGTEHGLSCFKPDEMTFHNFRSDWTDQHSLIDDQITDLFEDEEFTLWIGTNKGLNLRFHDDERFYIHQHDPTNQQTISENIIKSVYEDRSGIIWIGTNGAGLNKYDRKMNVFAHFKQNLLDPNSLSDNNVWSFYEDRDGIIWIGTNFGLNRYDPKKNQFSFNHAEPGNKHSLSDNVIRTVTEDHHGNIWCGTDGGGLNKLDRKTGKIKQYRYDFADIRSIRSDKIRHIHEDSERNLWIATWDGLEKYDPITDGFIHYQHDPDDATSISDSRVRTIYEDHSNNLWIGTYGGLNLFDRHNGTFKYYNHSQDDKASISNDRVLSMHEDEKGRLWIGTARGLNKMDRESNTFQSYTMADGLPNDVIYGIVEDNEGNLWLSTNKGLAFHDPNRSRLNMFRSFDVYDGLQSDEFNGGAYLKSSTGHIYFGGINGFNRFLPDKVRDNKYVPPIVLTAFKKFDKTSALDKSVSHTDEIKLTYKDNFFAFEFAALDYTNPNKNQYMYKLDGFDEDWVECGTRRYASYTNLDGGAYVFRVKGSNSDGVWNEKGASIEVVITPPFWMTWWFRITTTLLFLLGGYTYYRLKLNQIEKQKQILKTQVRERTQDVWNSNKRLREAQKKSQRLATQTRLLYEVGQRISKELDLDTLLNTIVTNARDAFDYYGVMLLMYEKKRRGVILRSIAGGYKDVYPQNMFVKSGAGMIGMAAKTKQTQLSNDTTRNENFIQGTQGVSKSELSIPIVAGKELLAVLDIQSDQINSFSESDIDIIETFSTQIASAIKNARLYEHAQMEINERKKAEDELRHSRDRLAKAKKETDSIFKNVEEGLFLLNAEGEIGAQYSASLETILFENNPGGKKLTALLKKMVPENVLYNTTEYLTLMFNDEIDDLTLDELNPLSETELNITDEQGRWVASRFLMFKFKRILNRKSQTSDLIVTVKDITDKKLLAQQLEQTEAEQKKQMEWMLSILHVEPMMLREFMDGAGNELDYISQLLKSEHDQAEYGNLLQKISRSMHLIKGNAGLLDLKFFEKKAHKFEDSVAEIKKMPNISGSSFIPLVMQLEDLRNTMKEIGDLIDRLGSIHNQFRPKREFENKVFLQSLGNLVNNLSKDYKKEIMFRSEEFDPGLIPFEFRLSAKDVLVQLIRNAVYHGIESPEERRKKEKPDAGSITITSSVADGQLSITVRDDGRGLQLAKLRESAHKLKQWDPAEIETWDKGQLTEIIFLPGISTADKTDLIAGRGVGMDAIREKIRGLRGTVTVDFKENEYCEFNIVLPSEKRKIKAKTKTAEYDEN